MTTAVRPHARTAAARITTDEARPADVLVVFGITGDLAKQMTFRSLYRLECRGLLDCPIVGVAVDDWTVDQLIQRARDSITGTGETLDELIDGPVVDRDAENRAIEQASSLEPVERPEGHHLREVAGDPEDHELVGPRAFGRKRGLRSLDFGRCVSDHCLPFRSSGS